MELDAREVSRSSSSTPIELDACSSSTLTES
jgi:hypothetical protein